MQSGNNNNSSDEPEDLSPVSKKQPGKKAKPKRDQTQYLENFTASLRVMRKQNPDDDFGFAYQVAAAVGSAVGYYAKEAGSALVNKLYRSPEPAKPVAAPAGKPKEIPALVFDNKDLKYIQVELKKMETRLKPLREEKQEMNAQIADLIKQGKQEISQDLLDERSKLKAKIKSHEKAAMDIILQKAQNPGDIFTPIVTLPFETAEEFKHIKSELKILESIIQPFRADRKKTKAVISQLKQAGQPVDVTYSVRLLADKVRIHDVQTIKCKITEADSKFINNELEKLETQCRKLTEAKKVVDAEIEKMKEAKQDIPKEKLDEQLSFLADIDNLLVQKVDLMAENAREHAVRRIDQFFLLAIAVYNKNVTITKGSTNRQHGVGSKKNTGTAACHSFIIPNPVCLFTDDLPAVSSGWSAYLPGFFFAKATPAMAAAPADKPKTLLARTYMEDVLNKTTELPIIVNNFDSFIEGFYGKQGPLVIEALRILNCVSKGEIDPVEALRQFCHIMHKVFISTHTNQFIKPVTYVNHGSIPFPKAFKKGYDYEKQGAERVYDPATGIPYRKYIKTILGVHNLPKGAAWYSLLANWVLPANVHKRILEMQKELLSTQSRYTEELIAKGKYPL